MSDTLKIKIQKWAENLSELQLTPDQEVDILESMQSMSTGVVLKSDQDISNFLQNLSN